MLAEQQENNSWRKICDFIFDKKKMYVIIVGKNMRRGRGNKYHYQFIIC